MQELKKNVVGVLKKVNRIWVDAVKAGEKEGIDLTEVTGQVIEEIADLDVKFTEAYERMFGKKKGMFSK